MEQTVKRRAARVDLRRPIRMVLADRLPVIPMVRVDRLPVGRKPAIALMGGEMVGGPVRGIAQRFRRSLKISRLYSMRRSLNRRI
jgi:hypothetical protein